MEKPKISLIIPAYNEEKYIEDCLLSIEKYGKEISEVIVVSNGSTDNTANIVKNFPKVRLIEEPQKRLPVARNRGLSEAKGDIVAFVDADTRLRKGWVEMIIKEFKKDENLVCLSGPYVYYDFSLIMKTLTWFVYFFVYPSYLYLGYMATLGNFVTRKVSIDNIGGFDNNITFYGDDTDISKRLHKIGKTKFYLTFYLPSSGRRLKGEGYIATVYKYITTFLWVAFKNKTKKEEYKEIR